MERPAKSGKRALYYQPIFDLESGRIFGAEALLRWTSSGGSLTPPEREALISSSGYWVLDEACWQASVWQREHPNLNPIVFVNLSESQLQSAELPTVVERILLRHGLEPDRLALEITETCATSADGVSLRSLDALRSTGVGVAIDDFGTGLSSLSRLRSLTADYLKLDRPFIEALRSGDRRDRALLVAMISLAHTFGAKAVAEGVESPDQLQQLREMGCDLAQGYHLSVPLSGEEASVLFDRQALRGG